MSHERRSPSHPVLAALAVPARSFARFSLFALLFLSSLALPACRRSSADELDVDVVTKVRDASVEILTQGRLVGSGWLADGEGAVVTASHVAGDARQLEIVTSDTRRHPGHVVAVDHGNDLALLQIDGGAPESCGTWLTVADALPPPGATAFLFGTPLHRHGLLLRGSVAREESSLEWFDDVGDYRRVCWLAAAAPPGTSGGCWVDGDGDVIGNQVGFLKDGSWIGVVCAAPVPALARLVETRESVTVASLNARVEELSEQAAETIACFAGHRDGLYVVDVARGGAAAKAGIASRELIVAADGQPVRYRDEFLNLVRHLRPGDRLKLRVVARDGSSEREVETTLGWWGLLEPQEEPAAAK